MPAPPSRTALPLLLLARAAPAWELVIYMASPARGRGGRPARSLMVWLVVAALFAAHATAAGEPPAAVSTLEAAGAVHLLITICGKDYVAKCLPMLRSLLWHRSTPVVLHIIADQPARKQVRAVSLSAGALPASHSARAHTDATPGLSAAGPRFQGRVGAAWAGAALHQGRGPRRACRGVALCCSDPDLLTPHHERAGADCAAVLLARHRKQRADWEPDRAAAAAAAAAVQNTMPSNFGRLSACSTLRLFAPDIPELAGIDRVIVMDTVRPFSATTTRVIGGPSSWPTFPARFFDPSPFDSANTVAAHMATAHVWAGPGEQLLGRAQGDVVVMSDVADLWRHFEHLEAQPAALFGATKEQVCGGATG